MDSMVMGIRSGRVVLYNPQSRVALAFSWRAAVDVAHAMMYKARGLHLRPDMEKVAAVRVRRDDGNIIVEDAARGAIVLSAPLSAAMAIGEALISKARELETVEQADSIIFDQAILQRMGAGFGLAHRPDMQREAMKEAHWNSQLRRYLPGGVRSQEIVPAPQVIKHSPRRQRHGEL